MRLDGESRVRIQKSLTDNQCKEIDWNLGESKVKELERAQKMTKTDDMRLATPCGEYCGLCPHYKEECDGCSFHKGHPSWGECKLYACALKHRVEHCGLCADFPCDFQIGYFNPNNPEGQRNAVVRAGLLTYRKKHGDRKWLDLVKKTPKARL